jgi:hypothetical protein
VGQDAETRKPASEQPGDRVRDRNVDLCESSLAEPHQQDSCGCDGDDYDGCGVHGSLALHDGIRIVSLSLEASPAYFGGVDETGIALCNAASNHRPLRFT